MIRRNSCAARDPILHAWQDREEGLLGVCDFFTSSKYDLPLRQMTWLRRFFW